jgi:hypothetical protein
MAAFPSYNQSSLRADRVVALADLVSGFGREILLVFCLLGNSFVAIENTLRRILKDPLCPSDQLFSVTFHFAICQIDRCHARERASAFQRSN